MTFCGSPLRQARFLDGKDDNSVSYASIDGDESLDCCVEGLRDDEAAWFSDSDPSEDMR
jgi:hypothetical protein